MVEATYRVQCEVPDEATANLISGAIDAVLQDLEIAKDVDVYVIPIYPEPSNAP